MEMDKELVRLARLRKARLTDLREFQSILAEAEELYCEDADLSDSADLFKPVAERVRNGLTVGDLRKLIFEACNILEESPLQLHIAALQLKRGKPIEYWEREALESANWHLETVKRSERRGLVERLVKLQDRIQK